MNSEPDVFPFFNEGHSFLIRSVVSVICELIVLMLCCTLLSLFIIIIIINWKQFVIF